MEGNHKMNGVAQTSIDSYRKMQSKLGERQAEVLEPFLKYPTLRFCDREISRLTRIPINVVTPRRGELAAKGLLEKAGWGWDVETKRNVQMWRLKKK